MPTDAGKRRRKTAVAVAIAAAAIAHLTAIQSLTLGMLISLDEDEEEEELMKLESEPRAKRGRVVPPRPNYAACAWSEMLRKPSLKDPASKEAKLFRRSFRVPLAFFHEIVKLVKDGGWLSTTANGKGVTGRPCIPIELKVLAALQILGRGYSMDDTSQMSLMSEATVYTCFHAFCKHFAEELYDDHVQLPTGAAHDKVMAEYDEVGCTGAIGSTDVAHVKWDGCPSSLKDSHTGEEGYPTIAYQATVDHTGRVLSVTKGFPGAQNDKTIIRYDAAVQRVREDPRYKDRTFHVKCEEGKLIECKGNYLLVGRGYHEWAVLMEPTRYPLSAEDLVFSKHLESVRKDAERFFGILKGRFRILKLPILFRSREKIDNVFSTCCILHNMLRAFDGLDVLEAGVDWAGQDGLHDPWIADPLIDVSTVGATGDVEMEEKLEVEPTHYDLKKKLMTSLAYRKKHNDVVGLK